MSDDFDVDYSDRSGFLVGRAAALADWSLRKDEREFNKICVALYMRGYRKAKRASGQCSVCKLPSAGRSMCAGHLAIWRKSGEKHRRKLGANPKTFILLRRGDQVHCLSEWARQTGIKVSTLFARWRAGWDTERALTEPASVAGRRKLRCLRGHPRVTGNLYGAGNAKSCVACARLRYEAARDATAADGLCVICRKRPADGLSRCSECKARRRKQPQSTHPSQAPGKASK